MTLTCIFYNFFFLLAHLSHFSSDICLISLENKDLIFFFVCTAHSTVIARSLSGPSLELLGITVAEIIITEII